MTESKQNVDLGYNSASTQKLMDEELMIPITIEPDATIRAKVTDTCGMTCTFCHNEGTPVALRTGSQALRVSIYESENGVNFIPGRMRPGDRFRNALQVVTSSLATTELHWTGGEPTLNRGLAALTAIATEEFKLSVKMTSNGELGARKLSDLAIAGLTGINFSIFGTTPSELTEVQAMAANDLGWAARKINDVNEALDTSIGLGLKTGANIVVRGPQDIPRVLRIVDSTHTGVQLRLQADLDTQREGWTSIYSLLSELGAHPESANISAGTSDAKITYRTSEGRAIIFKRFMSARLPESCTDCRFNNDIDCKEGYYGVRLYISDTDEYKLGICLRRMDLTVPLPTFVEQGLADEISAFRDTHRQELEATASDVLINRMRAIL